MSDAVRRSQLQEVGLRATRQRILVLGIVSSQRHVTVDQVVEASAQAGQTIDLSTAYRVLEALNESGLITHAHLGNGSPTYHSVDDNPHVHLVCRDCQEVGSIPIDQLAEVVDVVKARTGFDVDTSHLVMHGRCAQCASANGNADDSGKPQAVFGVDQL